jgi:selenocysteine lyase/cysteine desulfurase/multidrug efflux pump subunit AcrA (membrane-fusion protein)
MKTKSQDLDWKCPSVIGANKKVPLLDGRQIPQIFLDNAASTKPFAAVNEFLVKIQPYYSNIHRGTGFDSMFCTERYESARQIVGEFVGYDPDLDVTIPVRNTTEGMNLLANIIRFEPGDRVLTTLSEHHSNDLPWRSKAIVEHLLINADGSLDPNLLEQRLIAAEGKVRVVTVTGASNVLGTVLPIHEIAEIAHRHHALIVVDGAQLVPHRQVDMRPHHDPGHIDFLVFSGHKMNCPYGVSAVIGKKALFDAAPPHQPGGGTVAAVGLEQVFWAEAPDRHEGGTPNILGLIALAQTIQTIESIGMSAIAAHDRDLTLQLIAGLSRIPGVTVLGDTEGKQDRVGVVSFNVDGIHHGLVAAILSYEWGIAVRNGCFCAHPLLIHVLDVSPEREQQMVANIQQDDWRNIPGAVRASLGIHNTQQEIVTLVEAITWIARQEWKGVYAQDRSTGEFTPQGFDFDFSKLPDFGDSGDRRATNPVEASQGLVTLFPKRWVAIGATAIACVGGGWFYLNRSSADSIIAAKTPPLSVSTQVVTNRQVAGTQTLTGTIEPIEVVTTTSRVTGQIISLPVKEGDRVKAGQVLAKIDVKDLNAQQNQSTAAITQALASEGQAVAQITQAQAQRQQIQAQYRNAIAQKQSVQVELTNALLTQKRRVMLQQAGAIGQSSLDEINTQVAVLKTRLQQSSATIEQTTAEVAQATAGIARSQAAQAQARAQVKQAEASKSQVTANLNYGIVTAPFAGVITRKHTEVGAMAGTGQSIVTLENTSKQRFSVDVPESSLSQIKPGNAVTISFDSVRQVINGTVDRVIPTANPNSHSFNVKIALPPTTSTLISGMFGRLALPGTLHQGIGIPSTALIRRGQLEGVYIVGKNHQAILRWVKTGKMQQQTVEIVSGLGSGDRIVTSNLAQLQDGQLVSSIN